MWYEQIADDNQLIFKAGIFNNISGKAIFDPNFTRRYFLEKRWGEGNNILTTIMMNPSKAAHNETDKTVDQMIEVAKKQGCSAIYVVNISSIIDGSSSNLKDSQFAFDAINWTFVSHAMIEANVVFLGWGLKGQKGVFKQLKSNSNLFHVFKQISPKINCYDVLKSTDQNFSNKPMYYVPHPRPLTKQEKYRNSPIRQIDSLEFIQLFSRR